MCGPSGSLGPRRLLGQRELQALVVGCTGLTCMGMVWRGYGCVPILSTAGPSQRQEDWAAESWESSQSFSSWQEGEVLVAQSCLTLCNHMACSLPGSSVHGILQARKLEWHFLLRGSFQTQCRSGEPASVSPDGYYLVFFFFWCGPFLKSFIEFLTILLLVCVLVFWSWGMWNLISPSRDWTCTRFQRRSLNHWIAREVPNGGLRFLKKFWLYHAVWEILAPQPETEPMTPAVEAWSPNHWTTREFSPLMVRFQGPQWKFLGYTL